MIYYSIIITGFAGLLFGLCLNKNHKAKQSKKKCSENCQKKCEIGNTYGNFLEYDGSEKA